MEPDVLAGRGRRPPVNQGQLDADVAGLASLAEPTRRALYLTCTPRIAR